MEMSLDLGFGQKTYIEMEKVDNPVLRCFSLIQTIPSITPSVAKSNNLQPDHGVELEDIVDAERR